MKYKIKVYSIYEFGKRVDSEGNPHQEDSMFPLHGKACDDDRLFILCDGMGGHDAGEVASATVCEEMSRYILSKTEPEGSFEESDFTEALAAAFDALDEKDTGAVKKMGTTMTFLKLNEGGCFIAHIGDSRVYHIRSGKTGDETKILFVTEDHSLVNDLVKIGEITPEQAKTDRRKNVITRAMQPKMERRPRASIHESSDIKAGDYFYLCSDGMLEMMDDIDLCNIFSEKGGDDTVKVRRLTKATDGNRDNHSAIIVHVLDVEGERNEFKDESMPTPVPFAERHERETVQVISTDDYEEEEAEAEGNEVNHAHIEKANGIGFLPVVIGILLFALLMTLACFCLKRHSGHEVGGEPTMIEQLRMVV